jgi:mono/diheme cytochrome c family protein
MNRSVLMGCAAAILGVMLGGAAAQDATPRTPLPLKPMPPMPRGDLEHGRYIVHNVAMCVECHSTRDQAGTIIPEMEFKGGPIPFRPPWPNDWAVRAPRNAGLPDYTDEQAMRLLTQGAIDRQGVQLRPPMPRFHMTPQDAADVIAYMRSLK